MAQSRKVDVILKFVVSWLCCVSVFHLAFRDVRWVCLSLSFSTLVSSARLVLSACARLPFGLTCLSQEIPGEISLCLA